MTSKQDVKLQWIPAREAAGAREDYRAAPGQLGHQDFLSIARLECGPRRSRWKWSGFRADRAPHGFEGVSRSRHDAALAAEQAYFAD